MKQVHECELVNKNKLFGIFDWPKQNIFRISPNHIGKTWGNILPHVHGWKLQNGLYVWMKLNINEIFGWYMEVDYF
jgi:hypothetical protein